MLSLQVGKALPVIKDVLLTINDQDVLTDACLAVSYLAEGDSTRQLVVGSEVLQVIVNLFGVDNDKVLSAALRAVGNVILAGNEAQVQGEH